MSQSDLHFLTLSQRPCVVQYLEHYNKFIVGTYELLSSYDAARAKLPTWVALDDDVIKQKLASINDRAGKLILIDGAEDAKTTRVEYEFDCEIGGGIFDMKVRYDQVSANYSINVAHANGVIGLYTLSLDRGNKISLKEHTISEGSTMLTCIDLFPDSDDIITQKCRSGNISPLINAPSSASLSSSENTSSSSPISLYPRQCLARTPFIRLEEQHTTIIPSSPTHQNSRLVVGDSAGFITVLNRGKQIRADVSQGDSVWQVKTLKLSSNRYIFLVGAENSAWFIYGLEENQGFNDDRLILLYKNCSKDFSAGVTSITLLETMRSAEYDLFEILLGSYDETLQMYHVKINQEANTKPDVCHKHTIPIDQGGIWRVKLIRDRSKSEQKAKLTSDNMGMDESKQGMKNTKKSGAHQLCIAAMYAGTFTLSLASFMTDTTGRISAEAGDSKITQLVDLKALQLMEKPLHYDIDVTSSGNAFLIADFNNSLCLIKTINR